VPWDPETTALYEVVRDNLETLYGAIGDGAIAVRIPKHARKELALAYDKPLCASLDGFTLHAATRAGALHPAGREARLRYVLRPPVAGIAPAIAAG